MRGGGVQDLRGFKHFEHEGGLRVGHVVGGANAGVDGVNRPQAAARGGHVAAHAGQQHNQGDLPHVGGLAAHVGAGDDLHFLLAQQAAVVGDEAAAARLIQARFHHGVAALGNVNAGFPRELGRGPVQRQGAFGQGAQRVEGGQCRGQPTQCGNVGLQLVQQLVEQPFFTGQGAVLRGQGLVFKGFELGGDVTLGVFQGLAAAVVVGHLAGLALADFDEKAMHLVELHLEVGNAGAGALAAFQVEQKRVAVGLDAAQLVQVRVAAVVDDAAVADQCGRLVQQKPPQQVGAASRGLQIGKNSG